MKRSDQLKRTLEGEIATGEIAPGTRLDEESLAKRFGVSRTPVREALHQLASIDLVEMRLKRGAFVKSISFDELLEMFEVMAEMEALSGRWSARRMSHSEEQKLNVALNACEEACESGDSDVYYDKSHLFFEVIYAGTHNEFLARQARRLRQRLEPYRRLQLRVRNRMKHSIEEHRQIAAAIIAGQEDEVEQLLRNHVIFQGDRFGEFVYSLREHQKGTG